MRGDTASDNRGKENLTASCPPGRRAQLHGGLVARARAAEDLDPRLRQNFRTHESSTTSPTWIHTLATLSSFALAIVLPVVNAAGPQKLQALSLEWTVLPTPPDCPGAQTSVESSLGQQGSSVHTKKRNPPQSLRLALVLLATQMSGDFLEASDSHVHPQRHG